MFSYIIRVTDDNTKWDHLNKIKGTDFIQQLPEEFIKKMFCRGSWARSRRPCPPTTWCRASGKHFWSCQIFLDIHVKYFSGPWSWSGPPSRATKWRTWCRRPSSSSWRTSSRVGSSSRGCRRTFRWGRSLCWTILRKERFLKSLAQDRPTWPKSKLKLSEYSSCQGRCRSSFLIVIPSIILHNWQRPP